MSTTASVSTPLPAISRPAMQFLETQSAIMSALNMLKGLLALALLALAILAGIDYRLTMKLAMRQPLVVRINDFGRPEGQVASSGDGNKLQVQEVRYFLDHFVQNYYSRRHARVEEDYTDSLYFLEEHLYETVQMENKRSHWLATFISTPNAEETDVRVLLVEPGSLDKAPYSGRVTFEKHIGISGQEPRIEHWTANIQFAQVALVTNDMVPHNPLGLAISDIQLSQEFKDGGR